MEGLCRGLPRLPMLPDTGYGLPNAHHDPDPAEQAHTPLMKSLSISLNFTALQSGHFPPLHCTEGIQIPRGRELSWGHTAS